MPLATSADMPAIRTAWNARHGIAAQVSSTWNPLTLVPQQAIFIRRDSQNRLAAALYVTLSPHPEDDTLQPEMRDWGANAALSLAVRVRALWGCAKDMADFYRPLGYTRTFGRPNQVMRDFVRQAAPGDFREYVKEGRSFIVANDQQTTRDFLANNS